MPAHAPVTCDVSLKGKSAPEWVQLFPVGQMQARDGRRWKLTDPERLIAAFEADKVDIAIDYEHQADKRTGSGPVPAAGWIRALAVRDGALWGRVEWTERARKMIEAREYRYLSPSFMFDRKQGEIIQLVGAGLVHRPALHLKALAEQETTMDPSFLDDLTQLLGLEADATPDTILASVRALRKAAENPDPARFAPVEAMRDLLHEHHGQAEKRALERAEAKVEEAFQKGYLTGGMRDWALQLCRKDEASFDDFLASAVPQFAYLTEPTGKAALPPESGRPALASQAQETICAQLGLKPDALS